MLLGSKDRKTFTSTSHFLKTEQAHSYGALSAVKSNTEVFHLMIEPIHFFCCMHTEY